MTTERERRAVRAATQPHRRTSGVLPNGCLPGLLRKQAEVQPEATAVTCGDSHLTYRGLERSAGGLAALLHRLGAGPDDCVGLLAEPSPELVTGVWGILLAGAPYLPLSPDYPEERLRYMIEDSRTRVVVAQDHLAGRAAELVPEGTRVVSLREAVAHADGAGRAGPPPPAPDSLAYVIYTSGSTGRPKGVMIEHRSVVSQMRWLHDHGHLGGGTAVLQKTPMSFDAAQWEILAPAVGGRVVVGGSGIHRDPEALIAAVTAHEVTTLQCVPTLLQALLDTEEFHRCTSLRRVFAGGEALSWRLARTFTDALPWASLVNLYGPTECTINATTCPVDPAAGCEHPGTVPIGVPVDNTQCFILDADLAPVDIGETGELYLGGVQLARGYLHRPEQTEERFIRSPFAPTERLYRTGDLACWNPDGTIQFAGRSDDQVKLRGHRVELNEIALAIEEHTWVRRAAAVVTDDTRTGSPNLVACVELDPREAALMDQGDHGGHHQSKESRLQVRTQLAAPGVRGAEELHGRPVTQLPGRHETPRQRREVFARKTYRFYDGGPVTRADLLGLLAGPPEPPAGAPSRGLGTLTFGELGELLRWFGAFHSDERLLPKYAYASPGALYATQLYVESGGVAGLAPGTYYYHPVDHRLLRLGPPADSREGHLSVHFAGRRRAIEPVYRNNIREVLEFETGHMLGVFEEVLPDYGLTVVPLAHRLSVREALDIAVEDHYLGTFDIRPAAEARPPEPTELFVQAHPGGVTDLPAGQYRYADGRLEHLTDALLLPRHVIAINQRVHQRAGFGITAVSRTHRAWLEYVSLGMTLHRLQRNGLGLGLMSSGYSSKSGHPLPAALRFDEILASCGIPSGPSYFFLGGRVSEEQIRSEGMREDTVHMKGPAEIVKEELARVLPDFMLPHRVVVLDRLPRTASGKVDGRALAASPDVRGGSAGRPYVPPATPHERWLADAWGKALKYERVSAEDDFFAAGGNSLTALALVNRTNRELGTRLPLQVVFEYPRLADLAARVERDGGEPDRPASRLVPLHQEGTGSPVFCWPGLGGYPMNLRLLGRRAALGRPFYGVQAAGVNAGEVPYPTIRETAAADLAEIRRLQPEGGYTLWGYSFGARIAFEAAWQLEQSGGRVENLLLICPGSPRLGHGAAGRSDGPRRGRAASYRDPGYVTVLFSVFAGRADGPELAGCLEAARDEDGFVAYVCELFPTLDEQLVRRITRIVEETYEFEYSFHELTERRLNAPVTLFKAAGDDYSFIEGHSGYSALPPTVIDLAGDHYSVLRDPGIAELVAAIHGLRGG